eukprot:1141535-Pelagomonas_calceolata.AAC.9
METWSTDVGHAQSMSFLFNALRTAKEHLASGSTRGLPFTSAYFAAPLLLLLSLAVYHCAP